MPVVIKNNGMTTVEQRLDWFRKQEITCWKCGAVYMSHTHSYSPYDPDWSFTDWNNTPTKDCFIGTIQCPCCCCSTTLRHPDYKKIQPIQNEERKLWNTPKPWWEVFVEGN